MSQHREIQVSGTENYPVLIGRDLLDEIPKYLAGSRKVLIIHQSALTLTAEVLKESLETVGFSVVLAGIPDGEDAKRIEVASFCWGILGKSEFGRDDMIIGLGGGAATDLAGFVAASWLRGVGVVQIPTTLLAIVDAAIGGKTGVNTAEGKNLVGAFHNPKAVIADLNSLESLPRNDLLAGFAEVVKCGFIRDPSILDSIEADFSESIDFRSERFLDLVVRSIAVKAEVVANDFRESGLREILNYGHTLGHAIELAERYQWRHGAAVSVGMMFVAELARLNGRLSDEATARHKRILTSLGLPVTYPGKSWPQLLENMRIDKKVRAGALRFVVLDDIAKPTIMLDPADDILFTAFQEIAS